jgi:hypothetical protein
MQSLHSCETGNATKAVLVGMVGRRPRVWLPGSGRRGNASRLLAGGEERLSRRSSPQNASATFEPGEAFSIINTKPNTQLNSAKSIKSVSSLILIVGALAGPEFKASAASATNVTWTSAVGDLLWSTPANWDSNSVPGVNDVVHFTDAAGWTNAAGAVNNIVTANTTITGLRYDGPIANGTQQHYYTTLIQPGVTLTADNASLPNSVELVSASATSSANDLTYITIIGTGGATLAVGNLASPAFNGGGTGPDIWIMNDSTSSDAKAVVDMSQLDNFTFAGSYAMIGCAGGSSYENGALILARTNFIKTLQPYSGLSYAGFRVAAQTGTANDYNVGDLQLGQKNTIWTDLFAVGCVRRNNGTVEFQSSLLGSSPSLFLRGTTGANRVTKIQIGDTSDYTTSNNGTVTSYGVVDFTGGTVDILVDTMNVGRASGASANNTRRGSGDGTLTFTAGTIDANTVNIGTQVNNNGGSCRVVFKPGLFCS